MKDLLGLIQINVNEKIYVKDPNSSDLGKRIIKEGIWLIDEVGLESFTFKKLAKQMNTTESSIYRYFENKNRLLLYLISWYWGWMEYRIVFKTSNIESANDKLRIAIKAITRTYKEGEEVNHFDTYKLGRILISESSKAYLTKEVDEVNKEGFYIAYKRLVGRVSEIVTEINKDFKHPHTLISTIIEGVFHQKYFAEHLPSLTDFKPESDDLADFYFNMAISTIQSK
jgi:AcrR family transcriptional regulator